MGDRAHRAVVHADVHGAVGVPRHGVAPLAQARQLQAVQRLNRLPSPAPTGTTTGTSTPRSRQSRPRKRLKFGQKGSGQGVN